MMKRIWALILVVVMCLSLCACNNGVGSALESDNETSSDNSIIKFENVVLFEDEAIKLELANFYAEDHNWVEGTQNEKCFTVKATNKTNHEVTCHTDKLYLGDNTEKLYVCILSGTIAPDPEKSGYYDFIVAYDTVPEHTALDSLEDLYLLNGTFKVYEKYNGSQYIDNDYTFEFDVQAAINGEPAVPADKYSDAQKLSVGETAITDTAEITLTKVEYADALNWLTGSGVFSKEYGLTDAGMVSGSNIYALLYFDVVNTDKTEARIDKMITNITIDYNGGYLYGTEDHSYFIFDSWGRYRNFLEGYVLDLAALEEDQFKYAIPVAPAVRDNTAAPMRIIVELKDETFVYTIR